MHTEWTTLKRHVMPVNCINSELQNVFPWRNHTAGTRARRGDILALHSTEIHKRKTLCVCLCMCPVLPSFVCVCIQSKDCYNVNVQSVSLFITLTRKKEEEAEKNVEKGRQEGRKWWKRDGKASLMFPAKIFRLLPHDASPCPTYTHTLTHLYMYTQSKRCS